MVENNDSLRQQLRALREDFYAKLPWRIDEIKASWARASADAGDEEASQELYRLAHNLFGSSSNLGFETLSEASLALESRLKQLRATGLPITKKDRPTIAGMIMDLQQAALVARDVDSEEEPTAAQQDQPVPSRHLVYVVDDDPDVLKFLALQLGHRGYQVRCFSRPADALAAAQGEAPAVVVMDVVFPEGDFEGPNAIADIRRATQHPIGVVFLSSRGDMAARVRAMQAGGDAYLTKPVDVAKLADRLEVLGHRSSQQTHGVLIIDDDRSQTLLFKAILEHAGMRTATVTDPMQVMRALDQEHPDLILLDLYMPGVDGLDLVRVLRQRDDTAEVPIIFVSGETDPAKQLQAIGVGGDQFLTKPVKPDHLVSAVRTRIHHAQDLKESLAHLETHDPLTGLYNRQHFYMELEKTLSGGARGAVLYIDVDAHKSIQSAVGLLNADLVLGEVARVLRTAVGQAGALARFGGWAFALLVEEQGPEALLARAAALQDAVTQHIVEVDEKSLSVSCSVGISLLSPDRPEAGAIVAAAHAACNKARELGGTCAHLLDPGADAQAIQHTETFWRNRIATALEAEGMRTIYQPVVALRDSPGECYQALLRLQDSHGELTDAGQFIGHAEHTGQIVDVDRWSIWNASRVLVARSKKGMSTTLFVPISVLSARSNSVRIWLQRLRKAGVPARSLVLELDAAGATMQLREMRDFITRATELKIETCLTHFGVAADPWAITTHLQTPYLKLDRGLVQELAQGGRERARLPRLVEQAHRLDKQVIVPFVTDAVTMSTLWHCEVDYVQGYFIQEPSEELGYDFGDAKT